MDALDSSVVGSVPEFTIRTMKLEDVDKCLEIWAQVELTEARSTVTSSLALDPNAFNVAQIKDSNQIIGMCAAPRCCNGDTAFIGFYAVEPRYQNLGIGRELWSKTVGSLDDHLNKGLYGVPEMVEKYKKSGFVKEDSISMLVYETEPDIAKNDLGLGTLCTLTQLDSDSQLDIEIFDGSENQLFKNLVLFDAQVNRFSREELLKHYLIGVDIPLTVIVSGPNNSILGYGIIRKDNNLGGIIGPIYANNSQICEVILGQLINKFELQRGKIFTVMPLTSNQQAIEILERIGFVERHECSRLFTRKIPEANVSKIFYIHSPNFTLF